MYEQNEGREGCCRIARNALWLQIDRYVLDRVCLEYSVQLFSLPTHTVLAPSATAVRTPSEDVVTLFLMCRHQVHLTCISITCRDAQATQRPACQEHGHPSKHS